MEPQNQCAKLASRFQEMKEEEGLLDMKFFFGEVSETTVEGFCEEVNRMYKLVDEGRCQRSSAGAISRANCLKNKSSSSKGQT